MLQHKQKTLHIPRCRYLGSFVIPLGSILALAIFGLCPEMNPQRYEAAAIEAPAMMNPDDDIIDANLNSLASSSTYADNTLSLEVDGAGLNDAVKTLPGQVAYRAHTVKVTSSNIKSYTLTINGPVGLKTSTDTTIGGAGGKNPTAMESNTWGYAYGQTGENDTMTYSSFTGGNQDIDKDSVSPNFTKNLVFAAKFAGNAEAGHYQATVKLSLTATPKVITTYTLSYNANSGSNAPSTQTYTDDTEAGSHTFTISSSKPTRSGYEFSSWNTNSSGTGTNYNPGANITLSASSPTQTLYAVWKDAKTLANISTMQELNGHPGICTRTPLLSGQKYSAEYTLTDNRTYPSGVNKTYKVRKFADGRCWMTENLRIYNTTITSSNSDFTSGSISLPNSSRSAFSNTNIYTYQSAMETSSSAGATGYYNWYTATAGAGGSSVATNNTSVNTSICPKGWTLPTGGSASNVYSESTWSNYYKLFRNMGLTISNANLKPGHNEYTSWGTGDLVTVRGSVYNFKCTGYILDSSLQYGSNIGFWWSSTVNSNIYAYNLYIYGDNIGPGTSADSRQGGFPVRCIARN